MLIILTGHCGSVKEDIRAVARHIAYVPMSRAYYDKKRAEGKQHNQAIRALGRHIVRVIWAIVKRNQWGQTRLIY